MIGVAPPPFSETLKRGDVGPGAKTMTPDGLQAPPFPSCAAQSVRGEPAVASIVFSFPDAKKPSAWPSADQKGYIAPSVPERARASTASSERT